jgi:signal-transduction protein with cAMP-binding, CBS, and nucleotidyltransferase domain
LACFSERELAAIESVVIVKKFSRNQVIQLEEEASDYFYFIYAGKVKVLQNNDAGKELLLTIHKRRNVNFGWKNCSGNHYRYRGLHYRVSHQSRFH